MTTKYRSLTLQLPSTEERDAWSRHLDELEAEMNKHIHQCQTHGVKVVNTPAGTITINSDPLIKPWEFRLEQASKPSICPKCFVSPEVTLDPNFRCAHGLRPARREEFVPAPAPAKPDTFNVGDYVRLGGIHEGDVLWTKGRITEIAVGHATMVVAEAGRGWLPSAIGTKRNAPLDRYTRCDPPAGERGGCDMSKHGPSPTVQTPWMKVGADGHVQCDPLDVEYDGVKLRQLLDCDQDNRRLESPVGFTPAQRAAVSAHWSAQLRAKVQASAAAERERERNRVVLDQDADDMPWRTW